LQIRSLGESEICALHTPVVDPAFGEQIRLVQSSSLVHAPPVDLRAAQTPVIEPPPSTESPVPTG
jgi:hypothetical protein